MSKVPSSGNDPSNQSLLQDPCVGALSDRDDSTPDSHAEATLEEDLLDALGSEQDEDSGSVIHNEREFSEDELIE